MKILGFNIGSSKSNGETFVSSPLTTSTESTSTETKEMGFLAQISVGDRDLSKPYVDDTYSHNTGMVFFGIDNLMPELINNLYLSSGIHASCINFKMNSIAGGGFEWDNIEEATLTERKDIRKFEIKLNLKKLSKGISKDYIKHGRAIVLIRKVKGKNVSAKLLDPSEVRNDRGGIFKDVSKYFISDNFQRRLQVKEVKPYSPTCEDEYQILELRSEVGGSRTYPLPDYIANANWTYLDGEMSYLHKQGIVNSINPSLIIKYPFDTTPEEKDRIKSMLQTSGKGAKNMGKVFTFFGKSKDQMPEIETVTTSQNDGLYMHVASEIKQNIAMSHQMNPALAGVAISGKLGNNQEIVLHYQMFEKNWVIGNRQDVQDFINEIAFIFGITRNFQFKRFVLIDDIIVEGPVDGETVDGPVDGEESVQLNEALQGLSAQANADIYRIIRDFNRGKLNRPIAVARLKAYGIDDETINDILNEAE